MLSKTPQGTGKLDLIESFDSVEAHGKYSEKVTDQAGKFGSASGKSWAKGYAKPTTLTSKTKKEL